MLGIYGSTLGPNYVITIPILGTKEGPAKGPLRPIAVARPGSRRWWPQRPRLSEPAEVPARAPSLSMRTARRVSVHVFLGNFPQDQRAPASKRRLFVGFAGDVSRVKERAVWVMWREEAQFLQVFCAVALSYMCVWFSGCL